MNRELVTVYLKSGHTVEIECDKWEFGRANDTSYNSYEFEGFNEGEYHSFDVTQIVGYSVVKIK